MQSELKGRLRNTSLPYSKALLPLFEAVVNSIQAIEEVAFANGSALSDYTIDVEVLREEQPDLPLKTGPKPVPDVVGFKVTDSGIGFTEENWKSFNTLDSLWKEDKGCRGVGRLMWLKAFSKVVVSSTFNDGELRLKRTFSFSSASGVRGGEPEDAQTSEIKTTVELSGFGRTYANNAPKTLDSIAIDLLEHCLWYFVRKAGVPDIVIYDAFGSQSLSTLLSEHLHASAEAEPFMVKSQVLEVTHVKVRASRSKPHQIAYCGAGRVVLEEGLRNKVPGLSGSLSDDGGEYTYSAYVTGEYLDDQASSDRISFNMSEPSEGLFDDQLVSFDDIRKAVLPKISGYLEDALAKNIADGHERLNRFVSEVAPKYRPLLKYMPIESLAIDPKISDRDLDLMLHKETFQVEQELLADGHDVAIPKVGENEQSYKSRIEHYLQRAADFKESDLANYVLHRKVIIDLLESSIILQPDGRYAKEDLIHDLIVPMKITSDDIEFRRQSLWLIDERLAFHHFLASDKPISTNPTSSSTSGKEPDVASIKVFNNTIAVGDGTGPQASISVIEIKRPMRGGIKAGDDEERDPITQALGYLKRLRLGAKTKTGRSIPNADQIPGYVYVIADFTESMKESCELHQLQRTADGLGYFGYHPNKSYNAYILVLSFDGLLAGAKERNRAFFDQLGLPSK